MQKKSESEKFVDANNSGQRVEKKVYELYSERGLEFDHDWDGWFKAGIDMQNINTSPFVKDF